MNKKNWIIIIIVISTVPIIQVSGAGTSLSSIITQTGTLQVPVNGSIHVNGDGFISTSNSGSTLAINLNKFYYISNINTININSQDPTNYLNDQMTKQSKDKTTIVHYQPLAGTINLVSISPIQNNINSTITLTLFDNDINTGKIITIGNTMKSQSINQINYNFNQGDNLYWLVSSNEKSTYELIDMNTQVVTIYNK